MNESSSPSQERDRQADAQQTDTDPADTAVAPVDTDTESEDQIDAALAEADAALTRAAESHDDYSEAITDATVALDEVDRLRGQSVPGAAAAGLVQTSARASIHLCHEDVPDDALADVATEAIEGVGHLAAMSRDSDATDEQVAAAATELFEILSKVEEVRAVSRARATDDEEASESRTRRTAPRAVGAGETVSRRVGRGVERSGVSVVLCSALCQGLRTACLWYWR